MADAWDVFPDAPGIKVGGDAWDQFPDVTPAAPSVREQAKTNVRSGANRPDYRPPGFFTDLGQRLATYSPTASNVLLGIGGVTERLGRLSDQVTDPVGLQDEIVGAGQFARQLASGNGFDEAKKAYSEAAERMRAERDVARDENTIAPEIIGGIATTGIRQGFRMLPTFVGRVGQSAKAGATFGGATGFAQGEGGIENRLLGAAEGAAIGAAAGPVITEVVAPAIGAAARATGAAGGAFKNAVQAVRGRQQNVDSRYARALAQQNMTPRQAIRQLDDMDAAAKFGKTQLDTQYVPADLGPVTRDLADTAAIVSSEARNEAGNFLYNRARGSYDRTNDYVRRTLGVTRENFAKRQASILDEQRSLSKPAYDKAYSDKREFDVGQVLFNRQFDDDAAAGPLRSALNKARDLFADPMRGPGYQANLTTERFDAGKRALDDMIGTAKQAGRNNEVRLLTKLKNELLNVVDDPKTGNPAYKAARDIYSSRAELLDALDGGRKFMRGDSETIGTAYKSLSTSEKRMFRVGVAQQIRRDLGAKRLGTDTVSHFEKPNVRAAVEEIMSPAKARQFYQLIELEQAMGATNNAVRGNSKTAQRQQNVADFSLGVRLGRAIKDRGLKDALVNEIFDGVTKIFAMRDEDAVALTKMLFETDRAAQRATLQRLQQTYGKKIGPVVNRAHRIALQRVANARRTLAGLVGQEAQLMGQKQQQTQP